MTVADAGRRGAPVAAPAASIVFIGGGPKAAMILERLSANLPALFNAPLQIHVVEPHRPGSGRIWRRDQSPLLMLNSMAEDVTMFTDDSVECAGPAAPGPSLIEWARGVLDRSIADVEVPDEDLAEQLRNLRPASFPTRRLQSLYLEWFFRRTVRSLGPQASLTVHREVAVDVSPAGDAHVVQLASGDALSADAVVVAVGHTDSEPDARSSGFARFAARHGLFYAPPAYTNDVDFSGLLPGQDAIVSGMGLAFIDLVVLLMEGRGGRFREKPGGGLEYLPSGREPRLWAGSRRGVPYRSKISAPLRGEPAAAPRYLTAAAVAGLLEHHDLLDFNDHLWPLLAKDAALGYYRELFTGHPERVSMPWAAFEEAFDAANWYSEERRALVGAAVPDPADRLEFEDLDRPLRGRRFADAGAAEEAVAAHIRNDLRLRDGDGNSETLGLFLGLLRVYFELGRLVPLDALTPESRPIVSGWWHGFFSYVDSGPPAHRLRELLALHEAGYVRFLGPDLQLAADEELGLFTAASAQAGEVLAAPALIEARLPAPAVEGSLNPLLAALQESGLGSEEHAPGAPAGRGTGKLLVDAAARILGRDGSTRPGLYAAGPATSSWGAGAFARPRSNAAPFRESDALARRMLSELADRRVPSDAGYSANRLAADLSTFHASLG
ncbi:FAD/NAD(P)-binding domain-containing protein [Arthrobacter sp. Marseille-P9274]|uniref:FAD/NAD(P)-binding protein n=1 Tax=Arthrobacter sp. Marseille-P9274 TaxID=2866572 RepID=UPI0021C99754|nr:FAD/NAD(P)-binding protein [Arthrobacter sp. Marseille-P9274]